MDLRKKEKNFSAQPQTSGAMYGDFEKRFFLDNHPRIIIYLYNNYVLKIENQA